MLEQLIAFAKKDALAIMNKRAPQSDFMPLTPRLPRGVVVYGYCPEMNTLAFKVYQSKGCYEEFKKELLDIFEGDMIKVEMENPLELELLTPGMLRYQ